MLYFTVSGHLLQPFHRAQKLISTDVLATLVSLEKKLYTLIDWIQDPNVTPEKRFELLQEIAEEAARYKLGGDDKIRVAAGACDGVSVVVF